MPDVMIYMFKYFWFIGAFIGLINILFYWVRISPVVGKKPELRADAGRLFLGLFFVLVLPYFILGGLQLLGGFSNMFYVFSKDISNVYLVISWAFIALVCAIVLYWFYIGDAARVVLLFRDQIGGLPNNETQIKMIVLLTICAATAGIVIGATKDVYNTFPLFK